MFFLENLHRWSQQNLLCRYCLFWNWWKCRRKCFWYGLVCNN